MSSKWWFSAFFLLGMLAGVIWANYRWEPVLKESENRAAAWQHKDEQNYPLAKQWREAYEKLSKTCEVKR